MNRSLTAALIALSAWAFTSCNNVFGDFDNPVDPASFTAYVIETRANGMTDLYALPGLGVFGRYFEQGNFWPGDTEGNFFSAFLAFFEFDGSGWSHAVKTFPTGYPNQQMFHVGADGNYYLLRDSYNSWYNDITRLDAGFVDVETVLDLDANGWTLSDVGGFAVDSAGTLFLTIPSSRLIVKVPAGTGVPSDFYTFGADIGSPFSLAISPAGELYASVFSDYADDDQHVSGVSLYRVASDGLSSVRVAFGGGTEWATQEDTPSYTFPSFLALLDAKITAYCRDRPDRIDFDPDGNIYYLIDDKLTKLDLADGRCYNVSDGISFWPGADSGSYPLTQSYSHFTDFSIDRTTGIIYVIESYDTGRLLALSKNGLGALSP